MQHRCSGGIRANPAERKGAKPSSTRHRNKHCVCRFTNMPCHRGTNVIPIPIHGTQLPGVYLTTNIFSFPWLGHFPFSIWPREAETNPIHQWRGHKGERSVWYGRALVRWRRIKRLCRRRRRNCASWRTGPALPVARRAGASGRHRPSRPFA